LQIKLSWAWLGSSFKRAMMRYINRSFKTLAANVPGLYAVSFCWIDGRQVN